MAAAGVAGDDAAGGPAAASTAPCSGLRTWPAAFAGLCMSASHPPTVHSCIPHSAHDSTASSASHTLHTGPPIAGPAAAAAAAGAAATPTAEAAAGGEASVRVDEVGVTRGEGTALAARLGALLAAAEAGSAVATAAAVVVAVLRRLTAGVLAEGGARVEDAVLTLLTLGAAAAAAAAAVVPAATVGPPMCERWCPLILAGRCTSRSQSAQ